MNKSKIAKISVALLAIALIVPTLFAAGMKESDPHSVTVRIVEVKQEGVSPVFTVRSLDNQHFTIKTDRTTVSGFPVSALSAGDYLEVTLDMDKATTIRYITPLVVIGAKDIYISDAVPTSLATLHERFSYTYGYLLLQSFASQGLFFDTGYYVKGALDGYEASLSEEQTGYYTLEELYANIEEYQETIWQTEQAPQNFSDGFADIAEVSTLAKPEDLTKKFSYTYGYLLAYNMLGQGIEIDGDLYAQGALDLASNNKTLMNEEEMQTAFVEYQQVIEEKYALWIEEVTVTNLADAEAFLDFNKNNNEDIVVTESGLQYQVLNAADGPKPTETDTVEVNYQLQLIDGTLVESSYDRGESAHFLVTQVIPGFSEALLNMNVGSVIRTWIHPDLGYGATGTENILPNSLLVFDIELVGIDK